MEAFITVGEMMEALSALPSDARLVVTQDDYCYSELARVGLPVAYTIESDDGELPEGTVVYTIGHSSQNY